MKRNMNTKTKFILCFKPECVSPTVSLGTVKNTNWSLVVTKDTEHLQSIEICRSNGNEIVKMTGYIRFKNYDEEISLHNFDGYLQEGQLNFFITRGCIKLSGCELNGTVTICSTDQPALSEKQKIEKLEADYCRLLNQLVELKEKCEEKLKVLPV